MSQPIEAVLPFRLDDEALDIAFEARSAGLGTLWIGEMGIFDAIALASAIGHGTPGLRAEDRPLAVGVRSPVSIALGTSSVATLTASCHPPPTTRAVEGC